MRRQKVALTPFKTQTKVVSRPILQTPAYEKADSPFCTLLQHQPESATSMRSIKSAVLFAVAGLLGMSLASSANADACPWRLRLYYGVDTTASAMAHSGQKCVFPVYVHGSGSHSSLTIVSAPQHGVATAPSRSNVTYQSLSGYKGTDTFVFVVAGKNAERSGTSKVTMTIKVD